MSNLTVENVYIRHTAKLLTRKHLWKLVRMMLTVAAICVGVVLVGLSVLMLTTGGPWSSTAHSTTADGTNVPFMIGYLALILVMAVVSGGLSLGFTSALLDLCRGAETVSVKRVFSRMSQCLKALGLSLWTGLKLLLWALPGYVLLIVGVSAFAVGAASNGAIAEADVGILALLSLVGMLLIFAMMIPAYFRYILSTYVLADAPETGIRDCVKQSKAMMKGHKWQCFKLTVPIILLLYAIVLGMGLVTALVTSALTDATVITVVELLLSLCSTALSMYFSIRMTLCYCLFYLQRKGEQVVPTAESAE